MVSASVYIIGLLILTAFVLGAAAGVFFTRRGEAGRLDLALMLRSIGEAERCPDHVRVPRKRSQRRSAPPLADAYDSDEQSWTEAADMLGTPVTDYTPRREAC